MTRRTNKKVPKNPKSVDIVLATDGSCRANGMGGWAVIHVKDNGSEALIKSGNESKTTNNQMEYKAIIEALIYLKDNLHKHSFAIIKTDSMLVVQQILGENRVRGRELKLLWEQTRGLLEDIEKRGGSVSINWYPRSRIRTADYFAKRQSLKTDDEAGRAREGPTSVPLVPPNPAQSGSTVLPPAPQDGEPKT